MSFHGMVAGRAGNDFDRAAVDADLVSRGADVTGEGPIRRVVLQKVGVGLCVGQVVDGDDVQLVRVQVVNSFVDLPADAAEAVNAYADGHGGLTH
jgi:hypothetical protein